MHSAQAPPGPRTLPPPTSAPPPPLAGRSTPVTALVPTGWRTARGPRAESARTDEGRLPPCPGGGAVRGPDGLLHRVRRAAGAADPSGHGRPSPRPQRRGPQRPGIRHRRRTYPDDPRAARPRSTRPRTGPIIRRTIRRRAGRILLEYPSRVHGFLLRTPSCRHSMGCGILRREGDSPETAVLAHPVARNTPSLCAINRRHRRIGAHGGRHAGDSCPRGITAAGME